jgi:DNA (cytosine-5)-methyltransferase 1
MGYKLAGCDVVGGVDIDERMSRVYRANLKPRHQILSDIRTATLPPLPIDILDGSPPCTPFSFAGVREKSWGREKQFAEGQATQRLDDLFFAFIAYAAAVRPRVVVAENVTGMLAGNARSYVRRIVEGFAAVGYTSQLFQLTAVDFGVPQRRERVFFVAQLTDSYRPLRIEPTWTAAPLTVGAALEGVHTLGGPLYPKAATQWPGVPRGRHFTRHGTSKLNPDGLAPTITAAGVFAHWDAAVELSGPAIARLQSFPDDYDFGTVSPMYVCGMSVPPYVTRGIARAIIDQLL